MDIILIYKKLLKNAPIMSLLREGGMALCHEE